MIDDRRSLNFTPASGTSLEYCHLLLCRESGNGKKVNLKITIESHQSKPF